MQVLKISLPGSLRLRALVAGVGLGLLAGCGAAPGPDGVNDPFEPTNRKIHAFNRGVDQMFLGPTSKGYGRVIPKPVSRAIGNLADTLDLPGDIANNLLQFRIGDAAQNPLRMAKEGVEIGYQIKQGKAPKEATILIPVDLITRDNVKDYKGWVTK